MELAIDDFADEMAWRRWVDGADVQPRRRPSAVLAGRRPFAILVPAVVAVLVVILSVAHRPSGVSAHDVCMTQAAAVLGSSASRGAVDAYVRGCVAAMPHS